MKTRGYWQDRRRITPGRSVEIPTFPERFRQLLASRGKWLAVVAVLLFAGLMVFGNPFSDAETDCYNTLRTFWTEHQQLRETDASLAQWTHLVDRVEQQLPTIVRDLSEGANSGHRDGRIRRNLLFAARDDLPQLLIDARQQPSKAEASFVVHLEEAGTLLGVDSNVELPYEDPEFGPLLKELGFGS